MITCYIGIGSNLGDRREYIDKAIKLLDKNNGIEVRRVSSIYETEPVGGPPQGKFLNGVVEIDTELKPGELLKALADAERMLGRKRSVKNAPRTIDLDILFYGNEKIKEKNLVIPHPRIHGREFVLRGLRELGKAR